MKGYEIATEERKDVMTYGDSVAVTYKNDKLVIEDMFLRPTVAIEELSLFTETP